MISVRDVTEVDLDAVLDLNNAAVPAVSAADRAHLERLVEHAALAWVVSVDEDPGEIAGFVLLFEPGAAYDSPNYRWFEERYDRFLYVDRVVIGPAHRGAGLGGRLYALVAAEAERRGAERVAAEVNVEPPNPGSSRFHRREGFGAVGILRHGDDYAVEMLVRPVG